MWAPFRSGANCGEEVTMPKKPHEEKEKPLTSKKEKKKPGERK